MPIETRCCWGANHVAVVIIELGVESYGLRGWIRAVLDCGCWSPALGLPMPAATPACCWLTS